MIRKEGWLYVGTGTMVPVPQPTGRPEIDTRRWGVWAVQQGYFNAQLFCAKCGHQTLQSRTYVGEHHRTYRCVACGTSGRWFGGIMVGPSAARRKWGSLRTVRRHCRDCDRLTEQIELYREKKHDVYRCRACGADGRWLGVVGGIMAHPDVAQFCRGAGGPRSNS